MHTAAQSGRPRPNATFVLILALSSLFSLTAFGQDDEAPKKKSVTEQIQELAADLERRGAVLDELSQKFERDPDRAAAVMLEKEVSDRRAPYRRDVATLVELVLEAEDAGAEAAQGRSMAIELL